MMRCALRLLLPALLLVTTVSAQFAMDVEIRPRFEIRDGYKLLSTAGQVPAALISQRSRLNLFYSQNQVSTRFSLQDVRVWGDESNVSSTGVNGDPASIDLYEAWVEYHNLKGFGIRIGRQPFSYDDQRLLSRRNWNQNGMCYDALLLRYKTGDWQFDLAMSLNNNSDNTVGNIYPADRLKTLNFLYIKGPLSERLSNSVILLGSGVTASDSSEVIYMRGTLGDNWRFTIDKLDLRGTVYYQFGKNENGQKVSAYLASLTGLIRLQSLKAGGSLVYISGQDAVKSGSDYQNTDHRFDILYGTRHSNYGHLSYFGNIPRGTADGGLTDACLKLQYGNSAVGIQMDAHNFFLASNVVLTEGSNPIDSFLGTEVDIYLKWTFHPSITLQGGYAIMRPGESLEQIQGLNPGDSDLSHLFWLMLDFKSSLFQGI